MIALSNQFKTRRTASTRIPITGNNIEYALELVPHPEGHFFVGDVPHRPEWPFYPVPVPDNHDEIIEMMISVGLEAITDYTTKNKNLPKGARVVRYNDGQLSQEVLA